MQKHSRDEEILQLINQEGYMSIRDLAQKTYTSQSTVRRDLERMEQQGLLRRRHGGAESIALLRPPQILRKQHNQAQKHAIARRAAALVTPGSTIFLDVSTTVQYMVPFLSGIDGLTVYTNGEDTAIHLGAARIRTICTGGELLAKSMAYVGPVAEDTVRRIHFDAVFFSCAGFDDDVISDWSEKESVLRRVVMEQSEKKYFLADHTKQGKRFTHIICRIGDVDEILSE